MIEELKKEFESEWELAGWLKESEAIRMIWLWFESKLKSEIAEACKKAKIEECKYWRELIFSPEQQAIKPTISLTDFQLRIVELSAPLDEVK